MISVSFASSPGIRKRALQKYVESACALCPPELRKPFLSSLRNQWSRDAVVGLEKGVSKFREN